MARIEVNSDALFHAGDQLGAIAVTTENLSADLSGLNNRIDLFLGTWVTAAGQSASGLILESRQKNDVLNEDIARLCQQVVQVAASYSGAEEYAAGLLQKYEAGGVSTSWVSDQRVGLSFESIVPANLAFIFGDLSEKSRSASQNSEGFWGNRLSYAAARGLFGAEKMMDAEVARGNILLEEAQRQDSIKKLGIFGILSIGFDAAFRTALPWLNRKATEYGTIRALEHSEVVNEESVNAEAAKMVLPISVKDIVHNLAVSGDISERIDEAMEGQGRVEQYQGIVVQIVENADGTETAFVYVTGTDFDSRPLYGDPSASPENLNELMKDPNMPLEQGTASMQLVEQALQKAGVKEGTSLVVAGFSKGATTAVNFVNNRQMQNKYKMEAVYDVGGPTGQVKLSDSNIKHIKIADQRDVVVGVGGSYSPHKSNMDIIMLESDESLNAHNNWSYACAAENSLMAQVPVGAAAHLARGAKVKETTTVAGSTQPKGKTEKEMKAYAAAGEAAIAYDVLDYAEEFLPQELEVFGKRIETRLKIPNMPDLPTLVTEENTAGEYFEVAYKGATGKDWDSTPPELNLSPEHFKENEKSYHWNVGPEDLPHFEISIDSGEYSLDVDWAGWKSEGEGEKSPLEKGIERGNRGVKKIVPIPPEDVWEVPQDVPSQHPEPQYEYVAPAQRAPVSAEPHETEDCAFEFVPATSNYESVGGNF